MTLKKLQSFIPEFKENAVNLVIREGMSIKKVSLDLGVGFSTLQTWVRNFKIANPNSIPTKSSISKSEDQKKMEDLIKQNRQLTMERDILKKAMAFFVQVPK